MRIDTNGQLKVYFYVFSFDRSIIRQSQYTESLTNIDYVYLNNYNDYLLYKLVHKNGSTPMQLYTVNKLLEIYLQKSFETPERSYPYVTQLCGTTILAFFARNTTPTINNINAILMAHLETDQISNYVCYLSVLKEHRQKGLGTKLLNEFINQLMPSNNARVTLHVNTENTSALSLYLTCGMRCINFIPNYYLHDRLYATSDAFFMALQIKNVRNSTAVCQSPTAIDVSFQEQILHQHKCPQISIG